MKATLKDEIIKSGFTGSQHRATLTVDPEDLSDGFNKIELVIEGYDSMPDTEAQKIARAMGLEIVR